jgi:hypothetical protein
MHRDSIAQLATGIGLDVNAITQANGQTRLGDGVGVTERFVACPRDEEREGLTSPFTIVSECGDPICAYSGARRGSCARRIRTRLR